ncbi:LuxR C-terminal-related transcriptional regulator [Streptomyces sp. NPDC051315]|uniref:helix-turn-helix transcriptional regulator n=1 Tax=Streptomyces sp. NPDC051315 TaxID=3365650 RepID=UPI0037910843
MSRTASTTTGSPWSSRPAPRTASPDSPALAALVAADLWEDDAHLALSRAQVDAARRTGSLGTLSVGLTMTATVAVQTSDHEEAAALIAEQEALTSATGAAPMPSAQLHLGLLAERTGLARSDWARGIEAYCRALVAGDDDRAEEHFLTAVTRLDNCVLVLNVARARPMFGQWLRRAGRRREARDQLHCAHRTFTSLGAEAFTALAAKELQAVGEQARRATDDPLSGLTSRELHIAQLVSAGARSKEIAMRLFLSRRTVDAHLRNIFRKLGITSRRQLREGKGSG